MVWPGIEETDFEIINLGTKKLNYCVSLFETITILSNGDVVPCCYDIKGEKVFGNILSENIFKIWQKEDFSNFRKFVKNNEIDKLEICEKCINVQERYLVRREK